VFSVTDPYSRILGFLDRNYILFYFMTFLTARQLRGKQKTNLCALCHEDICVSVGIAQPFLTSALGGVK
jgi:hypothetical protein